MTKTLIIAEKPSVAQDIVRALTPTAGKFEKFAEYFESDRYVVTSAVGHLAVSPAALRPGAHRQGQDAPERGRQAGAPQGRHRPDQRLRRGPRGRADLPPDRPVRRAGARRVEQAGAPAVAAEHDAAGHPRRLRQAAHRRTDAGPGRGRAQP